MKKYYIILYYINVYKLINIKYENHQGLVSIIYVIVNFHIFICNKMHSRVRFHAWSLWFAVWTVSELQARMVQFYLF